MSKKKKSSQHSEFRDWFTSQFGPRPKRSVQRVRRALEDAQWKLSTLKRELAIAEQYQENERAALYAWQAVLSRVTSAPKKGAKSSVGSRVRRSRSR